MSKNPLAIHLAAGTGTRLRPITDDRPKPLVTLGGESLLERNIETLRKAGVTDQLVITGYEADQIRDLGYRTVHNPVYDDTDMVYSLFCAEDEFPEKRDLLISYGDILYEQEVIEALLGCDSPICLVVDREWRQLWEARFEDPLSDAETLRLNDDGSIAEIGNEPGRFDEIEAQFVGLLTVREDHIEPFTSIYHELSSKEGDYTRSSVEMTHFLQRLVDEGWNVQAVPIESGWLEIDTIDDLNLYRDLIDRGTLAEFVTLESTSRG